MAEWQFRTLNPNDTSGTSTSEDNFAQEERTSAEILMRECIQNPLDARNGAEHVEVHFRWGHVPASSFFAKDVFTAHLGQQLVNGKVVALGTFPAEIPVLMIEDFGTTGLIGTYEDSSVEGAGENWNAFWFREGEGVKPTKANGGAGQGKLTMFVASGYRTVLAMTKRTDGKRLFFGSCRFRRNYLVGKERYAREARFGSTSDPMKLSLPIANPDVLDQYVKDLHLLRGERLGTSFIIPQPSDEITKEALQAAVVNEFYFPILRGRLTVYINDKEISATTIAGIADELADSLRLSATMRIFMNEICAKHLQGPERIQISDAWGNDAKLQDDHAPGVDAKSVKAEFEAGKIISTRFPVKVSSVKGGIQTGHMRVYVQGGESVLESEELFVRQDLSVDKEKSLRASKRLVPARALVLIDDEVLSQYLAAAEEPTHREWNGSRPKLNQEYRNVGKPLRLVRSAASRLVEYLSPAGARDSAALALFFPALDVADVGKQSSAKTKAPDGTTKIVKEIPPPRKRKMELIALNDGARVRVAKDVEIDELPLNCELELAYGTEFGNSFEQWDAADFFLNEKDHIKQQTGVTDLKLDGNRLLFNVESPEATLVVGGFDQKRQLDMKLKYKDGANASDKQDE